jgi:hypothetical protein
MALLITHPDYMCTGERLCKVDEYPVGLYEELFEFVKNRYDGQYWHVLPREVASFWKEKMAIVVLALVSSILL